MSEQSQQPAAATSTAPSDGVAHILVEVPKQIVYTVPGQDLRFATLSELFDEIHRRSVACLLIAYTVEGLRGKHLAKVEGDICTVQSLALLLSSEVGHLVKTQTGRQEK